MLLLLVAIVLFVVVIVDTNIFYLYSPPPSSTSCSTCCCLCSVQFQFSLQFVHFGMEHGGRDEYEIQWVFHRVTFLLVVAIVLFVVVIVDTNIFYLFAASSLHFVVLPAFVCVVFQSNSAFNSNISAWITGAVIDMSHSKSFIDRCFFCLWQLCCLLL
jgi:surface protein